jgi:hypothetical protein
VASAEGGRGETVAALGKHNYLQGIDNAEIIATVHARKDR